VPALQPYLIEPIWEQFQDLLPEREADHPLGCHRPRVPDRVVFEKLIEVLVFGCAYWRIADETCSATTIRRRRDEWMEAGLMDALEEIALGAYDRLIGLELLDVSVDGCITKAPCGGAKSGTSPVDRGKRGIKRSTMVDANGIPLAVVAAGANRHDSPLLSPTLDAADGKAAVELPEYAGVHLDRAYDSTVALIQELRTRGRRVAEVTSSKISDAVLQAAGHQIFFEVRVDGNVAAAKKLAGKPSSDTYEEPTLMLGTLLEQAVVIEDAISGVQAGGTGGFGLVIGVARSDDPEVLRQNGADIVVRDLAEHRLV
jgi:beta-phosphoglucomutase-like phosphatase (HAD superfamily)/transposase